jgi:MFS family permease
MHHRNNRSRGGGKNNSNNKIMNSPPSREEEEQHQQFYDDEEHTTIIGATPTSFPAFCADDDNNIHNINGNNKKKKKNSSNNSWSWTALKLKLLEGFTSLQNSPSELYKVYFLKFLDSYSYFSFSIILTLFLSSDDFNYTDIEAGTIYGVWGMMITVYGFITGFVVDNLGVSKSLKLGYGLSLIARIGIFLCISKKWLLFHLYFTLPLGNCMGIPVLMTGIRRYTTTKNRGFAFGIFYVVMNIAALLSGPIVDILTIWYKGDSDSDSTSSIVDANGNKKWSLTSYRAIILSGIIANTIAFLVTFTVREIKVVDDDPYQQQQQQLVQQTAEQQESHHQNHQSQQGRYKNYDDATVLNNNNNNSHSHLTNGDGDGIILLEAISSPSSKRFINAPGTGATITTGNGNGNGNSNGGGGGSSNVTIFQPKTGSPYKIFSDVFRSSSFRRYLVVIVIMINVRQIFRHLDATWPKYMVREFGPNVAKGTIYALNPILIIILVPIVSATTAHIDPLIMIHYGSYISAMSVFFLVLSTSIWSSICFIIVLSIGEATWSPRLNDYTVSVSEEGREGTYMALSSAPLFLAKLPVGILSGVLLQKYCPETLEEGEAGEVVQRHSRTMWFIIGSLTATSPILLTCCWKYVSKKDNNNNNYNRHTTDVFQRNGAYTELPATTATTTVII